MYLSPSLQSVLHVFTVSQWSLFWKLQPRLYINISVSAICTSRIYSLAVLSFLRTSTCAHIYISPSLQSVLHVFTVWQWSLFLKLQPALIYIYLHLCNLYFTYLQSRSDLFSKTSTCAHIYLSPSLQSVLHVFTVSQWSLFLKLQPALIYIYPRLCNLYFTYLQSRSDLFSHINFNLHALIYIYLRLCNLYFTYLQSRSDLFS